MNETTTQALRDIFAILGFNEERSAAELSGFKKAVAAKLLEMIHDELSPEHQAFIERGEHRNADETNPTMQAIRSELQGLHPLAEWQEMAATTAQEVAVEYVAAMSKNQSADTVYQLEECLKKF